MQGRLFQRRFDAPTDTFIASARYRNIGGNRSVSHPVGVVHVLRRTSLPPLCKGRWVGVSRAGGVVFLNQCALQTPQLFTIHLQAQPCAVSSQLILHQLYNVMIIDFIKRG